MTISNHMLVGSAIALIVKQPLLALPLAFASHFALDAVPHFGYPAGNWRDHFSHRPAYVVSTIDLLVATILLFGLVPHGWVVVAAGLLAVTPDLVWPFEYYLFERRGQPAPQLPLRSFHRKIQWCERPWGIFVEIGMFAVGLSLVLKYLL